MRTRYVLTWREGYLCAATSSTDVFEPILRTRHYPLARMSEERAAEYVGTEMAEWRPYDYAILSPADPADGTYEFRLPGDAEPVATDVEEVPEPRTRCPARWRDGRWEKRLARRGWVPA